MYQTPCVNCRTDLSFDAQDAGELIQCENCGQFFVLPDQVGVIAKMGDETRQLATQTADSATDASEPSTRWNVPTLALLLLLVVSLVAVLFGGLATKILVPVLALAAINGYRLGGARVLATFAALAVATVSAGPLGRLLEGSFSTVFGTTGVMNRLVSVSSVAILVLLVSGTLLIWLAGRALRRRPEWISTNRWAGSVLGVGQGALLVCLLTWGVLVLDSTAQGRMAVDRQVSAGGADGSASAIVSLAESVRGSMFGSVAEKYNPLGELKVFSMPSKFLAIANNPTALTAFTEHPAVAEIKQRPAVVEAMNQLREDPTVRELIDNGDSLTGADLARILSSPGTLELLDNGQLMEDLGPIAAELESALDDATLVAQQNPVVPPEMGTGAISYQIHPPIQPWELTKVELPQRDKPQSAKKKKKTRPRKHQAAKPSLMNVGE